MKEKIDYKKQGTKNRAKGGRFELKVRGDLESKGWIVDKWSNNVEFEIDLKGFSICAGKSKHTTIKVEGKETNTHIGVEYIKKGKLIKAKRKYNPFNKALSIGTGFPDFIAFRRIGIRKGDYEIVKKQRQKDFLNKITIGCELYKVIGVESKTNGYLSKIEKEKCAWLLDKKIFSKILIAKKGKKRGEIIYTEFGGIGNIK